MKTGGGAADLGGQVAKSVEAKAGEPMIGGCAARLGYQVVATPPSEGTQARPTEAASANQTDANWKGYVHGVEHVNLEEDADSDVERRAEDTVFIKSLPLDKQLELERLQAHPLQWTTKGAQLIGNLFGAKATEDRFTNSIAFDDEQKCEVIFEIDGITPMQDITQGMRMAHKSGLTLEEAAHALHTYCGKCNIGCPIGGDRVLLKGAAPRPFIGADSASSMTSGTNTK